MDDQAQDRAYRIGQNKDVDVLRLVSRGTIEELKYLRQVYKAHLNKKTLGCSDEYTRIQPARLFRGVASDPDRKGELFGCENLLKFKDGSFMDDLWQASERGGNKAKEHDLSILAELMQGKEDYIENGFADEDEEIANYLETGIRQLYNHDDFLREDRGVAALNDDLEIGESQVHFEVYENACKDIPAESQEDLKEENSPLDKTDQSIAHNQAVKDKSPDPIEAFSDTDVVQKMDGPTAITTNQLIAHDQAPIDKLPDQIESFSHIDVVQKMDEPTAISTSRQSRNRTITRKGYSLLMGLNLLKDESVTFKSTSILHRPLYLDVKKTG